MNYNEIADRIAAQGVINSCNDPIYQGQTVYWIGDDVHAIYSAEEICHDWCVAGALMEKCWPDICLYWNEFYVAVNERINGKSIHKLPLAIVLATLEALEDE